MIVRLRDRYDDLVDWWHCLDLRGFMLVAACVAAAALLLVQCTIPR